MVADCPQTTYYSAVATSEPYTITSTVTTTNGEVYTVVVTGVGYKEDEYVFPERYLSKEQTRGFVDWRSRKLSSMQPVKPYRPINRKLLKVRSRLR